MKFGSEGWSVWSDPTDKLLLLKLWKKLMLIESGLNTHCIAVCCLLGCIAAGQPRWPYWPLATTESGNNGYVSIRTWPQSNGRKWPGLMNHISFYIMWMAGCVCVTYLGNMWHEDALWEEGNQQRQGEALCSVLMGNLPTWSCRPCVTLTCTTNLSIIAAHVYPFKITVFPDGCGFFNQDNASCH